ncbi:MAG: efflux transporter outer membrane subunit [Candidatus Hydrogenedentes bacterium]|nr:efflux transporter outer membrane subunit [Candidatus Hydrogenedentota bacterium]
MMLWLSSCVRFNPPSRSTDELPLTDAFSLYSDTPPTPDRWWEALESDELSRLIEQTLAGNFSLQQTYARLEQAARIAKRAGAVRWPEVTASSGASVTRAHVDTGNVSRDMNSITQDVKALRTLTERGGGGTLSALGAGGAPGEQFIALLQGLESDLQNFQNKLQALDTLSGDGTDTAWSTTTRSYEFGLASSYEVDLWGRLRSQHEAALLDLQASQEDVYTAMLTLASEVTLCWLDVLYYKQGLALLHEQLKANETTLELLELRFRKGLASALDVYQQRQIVSQTESTFPPLEAALQTLYHEIAVLQGKPPRSDLGLEADAFPDPGPVPALGIPADLLARRPDVRAAGLRLSAADWDVGAARADRLPTIRLSASASYGADDWNLVFDNWMATLAASLTGPVFDAGRRKAEVERVRAVVDERLAAYRESVIGAVQEVEDALVLEARQADYIDALTKQLEIAQATHREALARYRKGMNDYLPVLSALVDTQSLERSLVAAHHDRLVYRVQLHRALGGTWMRESEAAAANQP